MNTRRGASIKPVVQVRGDPGKSQTSPSSFLRAGECGAQADPADCTPGPGRRQGRGVGVGGLLRARGPLAPTYLLRLLDAIPAAKMGGEPPAHLLRALGARGPRAAPQPRSQPEGQVGPGAAGSAVWGVCRALRPLLLGMARLPPAALFNRAPPRLCPDASLAGGERRVRGDRSAPAPGHTGVRGAGLTGRHGGAGLTRAHGGAGLTGCGAHGGVRRGVRGRHPLLPPFGVAGRAAWLSLVPD